VTLNRSEKGDQVAMVQLDGIWVRQRISNVEKRFWENWVVENRPNFAQKMLAEAVITVHEFAIDVILIAVCVVRQFE